MSFQLIMERSLTTSIRSQGVLYVLVGCPLSRTGGDRPPGLLAAFVERGELRHAILQVLLGYDGVPAVDTLRLVPGELHGHGPGHAGPLQVPDRGAPEIMG